MIYLAEFSPVFRCQPSPAQHMTGHPPTTWGVVQAPFFQPPPPRKPWTLCPTALQLLQPRERTSSSRRPHLWPSYRPRAFFRLSALPGLICQSGCPFRRRGCQANTQFSILGARQVAGGRLCWKKRMQTCLRAYTHKHIHKAYCFAPPQRCVLFRHVNEVYF